MEFLVAHALTSLLFNPAALQQKENRVDHKSFHLRNAR